MRTAILGGSFDPPHSGHAKVAEAILEKLSFGEVWLMPCFQHAFEKKLSNAKHRLAMTKLLEKRAIKVSDYEIKKGGISYTIATLLALSNMFPNDSFFWIIGSDQIADFPKWEGWQEIVQKFGLIIVARDRNEDLKEKTKKLLQLQTLQGITFLQSNNIPNVSSTEIRERVKKGEPIDTLVPKSVEEYIKKHRLYR